jgi:hypothetical protein
MERREEYKVEGQEPEQEFTQGIVCGYNWRIETDVLVESFKGDREPCPHAYGEHYIEHGPCIDGSFYQNKAWYCPNVLHITPDDPYQCAAICIDCLLEKLTEADGQIVGHIENGTDVSSAKLRIYRIELARAMESYEEEDLFAFLRQKGFTLGG